MGKTVINIGSMNLPPGWRWIQLGEVCVLSKGRTPRQEWYADEGVWLVRFRDVTPSGVNWQAGFRTYVRREFASELTRLLPKTVLLTADAHDPISIGKKLSFVSEIPAYAEPAYFSGELLSIRPGEHSSILPEWPLYFLSSEDGFQAVQEAVNGVHLNVGRAKHILLPLPPLPEQKRIVAILNEQMAQVERARASAEAQLAAASALPVAYLREVFESEEARKWQHKALAELFDMKLGKMLSPASKLGVRSRPYLRNANVQWRRFDLSDVAEMDFSEKEEEKYLLKAGDLIVCEGGEPGRAAVWAEQISPCFLQKALHRLRPKSSMVDSKFIMYRLWFGAFCQEFVTSHAKSTIAHLPAIRLAKLQVGVPSLQYQQAVVQHLDENFATVGNLYETIKQQVNNIDLLPSNLLHSAFRGEL